MSIGVCITTRHRPDTLEQCLEHLGKSTQRPVSIVVSDDSSKPEMREATIAVVAKFPAATLVQGPRKGVCANRNNAFAHLGPVDYVAFLDDDALVSPTYFEVAQARYDAMSPERRERTILTGTRVDAFKPRIETMCRLDFACNFTASETPEVAGASYAVYPRTFFERHPWDERIYFGLEDAELSLRAMKAGYEIVFVRDMVLSDVGQGKSTLLENPGRVSEYAFNGEAARLYVGVKRYKDIEANYAKLALFVPLFFAQTTWSLAKRRSLHRMPELVRLSNVTSLLRGN
ncbi:MAG TPA: glycosyltransferase family A protein [Polyangiaceae bacterium]|jgi:GT2 family glycosyltransferase